MLTLPVGKYGRRGEESRRIKQHLAENVDTCSGEIWEERRREEKNKTALTENVDTCSEEIWEEKRGGG